MKLTIDRLGHHGDGIAHGPVFVPLTLPGEVVTGSVDDGRMSDVKILTPSTDRVAAPCRHFKTCGGCALQHASDRFVAGWKAEVVRTALAARGLEVEIENLSTSPPQTRRRARLSGRRTKKGALVGLHGRASGTIVEIPDCKLLHPDILTTVAMLREITALAGSRKAEISFDLAVSQNGIDLGVSGAKPLDDALRMALPPLAKQYQIARLSWEQEVLVQRAAPWQPFGSAQVTPPPGAFLQATENGQAALLRGVRRAVGSASMVADLFAGCGTFALPLAETAEVLAVEDDAEMLAALGQGWRQAQGLKQVRTECRDLFRRPLMVDELRAFEAVCIDPPRAGAEAQVKELANSNVPRVAFVSCNPVTFARDAEILCNGGYRLNWLQVVDQFRWSTHVELVAEFCR